MPLDQRHVAITGGAGGIGRLLCREIASLGARMTVVDRVDPGHPDDGFLPADLSTPDGICAAAAHLREQSVDVLVNLAGIQYFGLFENQAPDNTAMTYMVNLMAPVMLAQALVPGMKERGYGHIVNIGSVFGSINFAHFVTYSSSKAGLRGFSEALRRELGPTGIAVTYIASRAVVGDVVHNIDRMSHLSEQLLSLVRVQRVGAPLQNTSLSRICRDVTQSGAPAAIGKGIDISSSVDPHLTIKGNEDILSLLVRNLIDNAIKFTPRGGHIELSLQRMAGKSVLTVADDGPGIEEKHEALIFDSFYRVPGTNEGGCGLGLAIAKWAAEIHRADIRLAQGLGGKGVAFVVEFNGCANVGTSRPATAASD